MREEEGVREEGEGGRGCEEGTGCEGGGCEGGGVFCTWWSCITLKQMRVKSVVRVCMCGCMYVLT